MYDCPVCKRSDVTGLSRCYACGADLTILANLEAVADVWFNHALMALAKGQPGRALEWLSACCAARPHDAAARLAQAKVWAQLGHLPQARAALEQTRDLDPGLPGLADVAQALQEVERKTTCGKSKLRGRRRRNQVARVRKKMRLRMRKAGREKA